ncbi:hypothetical protein C8R45DRAFT_931080 [Mycena sanguinolenta]|nr:hypothetical protein C8R45DRAFT_931080 [Mycena sanguinolenta]
MNRVRRPTVDSSNGQWNMVEVSGRALPEAPPKAAGDRRRLADVTILSWRLVGNIIPQHLLMSDTRIESLDFKPAALGGKCDVRRQFYAMPYHRENLTEFDPNRFDFLRYGYYGMIRGQRLWLSGIRMFRQFCWVRRIYRGAWGFSWCLRARSGEGTEVQGQRCNLACFVHWDNSWEPAFVIRTMPCNCTYLPTYLPTVDKRAAKDANFGK